MTGDAVKSAARMGTRAGEAFAKTGLPSPMPKPFRGRDELRAAWRRAYLAAVRGARRR